MRVEDIRSVTDLTDFIASGGRPKYVFFWGHTPRSDGQLSAACFSQWYTASFTVDEIHYPTAEHYMMAEKARLFSDDEMLTKILNSKTPGEAKKFGRLVKGFDQDAWIKERFEIVCRASLHKFGQDEALKSYLINTQNRVLVEASPRDRIWGIGMGKDNEFASKPSKWRGLNLLGFALMEARTRLAS